MTARSSGGATLVHQHVRIGSLAITRGGTRLTKDVPPYFMAVAINQVSGINRLGLRRAGFNQELRRTIQAAYELIYRANLNLTQALAELRCEVSSARTQGLHRLHRRQPARHLPRTSAAG